MELVTRSIKITQDLQDECEAYMRSRLNEEWNFSRLVRFALINYIKSSKSLDATSIKKQSKPKSKKTTSIVKVEVLPAVRAPNALTVKEAKKVEHELVKAQKEAVKAEKKAQDEALNFRARDVIKAYCEAFKKRYGANPLVRQKDAGEIKLLIKEFGAQKLSHLIQVYVQMEDKWFITKKHDLHTFTQNINKIAVSLQTGKDDSRKKTIHEEWEEEKKKDEMRKAAMRGERLPTK